MGRSITSQRGPLPAPVVYASETTLTQFSGLVPFIRYVTQKLDIVSELRRVAPPVGRKRVFAVHIVLFAFMIGALAGVHRLAQLEWLRGDAVLLKFLRLPRWPVRKVFAKALAGVTDRGVKTLTALIARIGLEPLKGKTHAVADMDSSAVVSFGQQEGTCFGYSGKGRNRRRHHPLVSSAGENRAVIHADYRDGSAIDANEDIAFADRTIEVLKGVLAADATITLRGDSGFWSKKMAAWLLDHEIPFIFALPLRAGVKILLKNTRWRGLEGDSDIQVTEIAGDRLGMDSRLRVIGIRRRVRDEKAPPQGKTIDGCSMWRYQALVTCMPGTPEDLWRFYNDRSDCERIFKVARGALGMGWLISHCLRANEVAFLLRLLGYNADLRFHGWSVEQARLQDRPQLRIGLIARQRRFFIVAGRLLRRKGRWILRVRDNDHVRLLWSFYAPALLQLE